MNKSSEPTEAVLTEVRRCPQTTDTYAFQLVSRPPAPGGGTCVVCTTRIGGSRLIGFFRTPLLATFVRRLLFQT
jgi:hypothetical protein